VRQREINSFLSVSRDFLLRPLSSFGSFDSLNVLSSFSLCLSSDSIVHSFSYSPVEQTAGVSAGRQREGVPILEECFEHLQHPFIHHRLTGQQTHSFFYDTIKAKSQRTKTFFKKSPRRQSRGRFNQPAGLYSNSITINHGLLREAREAGAGNPQMALHCMYRDTLIKNSADLCRTWPTFAAAIASFSFRTCGYGFWRAYRWPCTASTPLLPSS
jgi:hypothetical protein